METILEKLKKIEALALQGSEGERDNARRLLEALCAKHGVTLGDLADEQVSPVRFATRSSWELKLICQVVVYVVRDRSMTYRRGRGYAVFQLTKAQQIDVRECFDHYRALWDDELEVFYSAFVQKNRIFGPPGDEPEEMTAEQRARVERMFAMMRGLVANPWEKRLRLQGAGV